VATDAEGAAVGRVARFPVRQAVQWVLGIGILVGAAYAAAVLLLAWMSRKRPSDLLRIPVWAPLIVVIVLCWLNT